MSARLLIVEDESIVALDIRNRLDALGYTVVGVARSAPSAIELARREQPDLVLMDINLQGEIDGIDVADMLQSELRIPIVFLTAFSDPESLERAGRARAAGYLLKPFHERELTITIQLALYKSRMERQLADEQQLLSTTLGAVPDGLIAVDQDQVVVLINPAAERITGFVRSVAIGRPLSEVLKLGPLRLEPELSRYGAGWRACIRSDHSIVPVEVNSFGMADESGGRSRSVVVVRDVGTLLEQQRQIVQAQVAIEGAARAKSEFLARISHELKTPLNSIVGMAEVLRNRGPDPETPENLRVIASAGRTLARLVDGLLQFVQADSGEIVTEDVPFEPAATAEGVIRRWADDVTSAGLNFIVAVDPETPARVTADRRRTEQILDHLVSNATKFTGSGTVSCRLGFIPRMPALEWRVTDTGRGIAETDLKGVFDPFSQVEQVRTRSAGGAGIGLALVHRTASSLGGTVDLESQVGVGTTVVVTLPCRVSDGTPPVRVAANVRRREDGPPIAVTDPALAAAIEPWAGAAGSRVVRVDHGEPIPPDAVVAVVRPYAWSPEVLSSFRDRTVVVVVTAREGVSGSGIERLGPHAARVVPVRQPVTTTDVVDIVNGAFDALQERSAADRDPLPSPAGDPRSGRVLIVDDDPLNRVVISSMLAGEGMLVDDAANAEQGLERLRSHEYVCVLTDVRMPGTDGVEFARLVRGGHAGPAAREVRIVAISAAEDDTLTADARAVGIDACLAKPVSSDELRAAIVGPADEWRALLAEIERPVRDREWEHIESICRARRGSFDGSPRGDLVFRLALAARREDASSVRALFEEMLELDRYR